MKKQYEPGLHKLDGEKGKVYIGIPRERMYLTQFVDSRDSLLMFLEQQERGVGFYQAEGHRVDRNRDNIAKAFMELENKPEWLHMIDSDMDHPRESSLRLISWEKPIVGGLYFHRGKTHDPFVFMKADQTAKDRWNRERVQWKPLRDEVFDFLSKHDIPMRDGGMIIDDPESLVECDAVATGSMVIHRSVFETMDPPWFEYRPGGYSEDLVFCDEAKFEYGIPIHCDLGMIAGHYNWVAMGHAQFRQLYRAHGVNVTGFTKRNAGEWLSEFLGITFEEAVERIEKGNAHMVSDYWRAKKPETQEEVEAFYKDDYTGQLYIIELLHWNFSQSFDNLRRLLIQVRDQKVLEIGAGIGTVAMQLAVQHNDVVAAETNGVLRDFIKYRWDNLTNQFHGRRGELFIVDDEWRQPAYQEGTKFDVVVSFDVLEHLTEKDLIDFIADIAKVTRDGGAFFFHANFWQQDLYPMHYDHSELFDKILADNGFLRTGKFTATKVK